MENIQISNLKTADDIITYIKNSTFNSKDMVYKELNIQNEIVYIVYNESMADDSIISDFVIRSIKNSFNEKIFENIDNKIDDLENEETENKKQTLEQKIKNKLQNLPKNNSKEIKQVIKTKATDKNFLILLISFTSYAFG